MRESEQRLQPRARQLRREMTDTELRLWQRLRGKQIDGQRFRRQAVIRPYIVDFLCLEKRLIVELDGGQHQDEATYDRRRDDYLVGRGFRVLRFWNNEVNGNMEGVLTRIAEALASPHPNPPPQAGEGMSFATDNTPSSACGTSPQGAGRDEVAVPNEARDGPHAHRGPGWGDTP